MSTPPTPECPYRGLQPYTAEQQAYFFGREREQDIIESNLETTTLTILHGASGVGKSSVLMAGVVPQLQKASVMAVVLFRDWQPADFMSVLKNEILRALRSKISTDFKADTTLHLADFLAQCSRSLGVPVLLIFDQFEEYFLYHPPPPAKDDGQEHFDIEFARAVNRRDVKANFLLSMREDSLSKLDRFQGRIPNLLGNILRLEHLDDEAATDAIKEPLVKFNELHPAEKPMRAEPALVTELLKQVQTGKVSLEESAQAEATSASTNGEGLIETPFLQMVLERLWKTEREAKSDVLRLKTLNGLGGAKQIISTHLDDVMNNLGELARSRQIPITQERAQAVAAGVFLYLVTQSGTKFAHTSGDLAALAGLPSDEVTVVLKLLALPDVRILRTVNPPPGQSGAPRYEIFHDVLAPAILNWRARYNDKQAKAKAEARVRRRVKRLAWITGIAVLLLLAVTGVAAVVSNQKDEAVRAKKDAEEQRKKAEIAKTDALNQKKQADDARAEADKAVVALNAEKVITEEQKVLAVVAKEEAQASAAEAVEQKGVADTERAAALAAKLRAEQSERDALANLETARAATIRAEAAEKSAKEQAAFAEQQRKIADVQYELAKDALAEAEIAKNTAMAETKRANAEVDLVKEMDAQTPYFKAIVRHGGLVNSAALMKDGKFLVTAGGGPTARIWSAGNTRLVLGELKGHTDAINSVAISQDGRALVTASADGTARVWDCKSTGKGDEQDCTTRVVLGDHRTVVRGAVFDNEAKRVVTADSNGVVRVWDALTGNKLKELQGHKGSVTSVAFDRNGQRIASASVDGTARVWNIETGEFVEMRGHTQPVNSVAFNYEGDRIVTASADGTARVWNARTGKKTEIIRAHRALVIEGKGGLFPLDFDRIATNNGPLLSASFSRYGRFVVTAGADGVVRVWDVKSNTQVRVLNGHNNTVTSAIFDYQSGLIVTASADGTARVWNPCKHESRVDPKLIGTDRGRKRFCCDYCTKYSENSCQSEKGVGSNCKNDKK